jgi:hypothetical protein
VDEILQNIGRGVVDFGRGLIGPDTHDAATARGGTPVEQGAQSTAGRMGQSIGDFTRGLSQEGLAGLLDYSGMMDRQAAQRELSSRFQVVGPDFVGPRNHNQVSEEEYERIARTYSDIRTGRGDLSIDTSMIGDANQAAEYRRGTMTSVADMMMTTSGRNQIMTLSNNVSRDDAGNARHGVGGEPVTLPFGMEQALPEIHRHTTIRPFFNDANGDRNYTNDPTGPNDYFNANAITTAPGATIAERAAHFPNWYRDATTGARGRGDDVTMYWNPTAAAGDCNRSDVILAHEMQHALHETQGTMAAGTYAGAGPDNGTQSNYERQAVGLPTSATHYPGDPDGCTENTYRAERNQLGLGDNFVQRTSYSGRMPGMAP